MKKFFKRTVYVIIAVMVLWIILTFWAERKGGTMQWTYGSAARPKKALVVYDPDPFYNFDEQVCRSFAEGLSGMQVTVATVAAAEKMRNARFDLYVFCANTYNWRPDWAVSDFIKKHPGLSGKPVVAITLGSGSTAASQRALEKMVLEKEADLIGSRSFWLMRPNDESRMKEKNVKVALSMVSEWAKKIDDDNK